MPAADPDQTKRLVIESLILAFSNTKASSIVGTDALRSVLDFRYRDLYRAGKFDLGPLLELLEEQPGYEAEPVSAAMFRVKSWEDRLGVEFKLPMMLSALEAAEQVSIMEKCAVSPAELARVLRGAETGPSAPGSADESLLRSGGVPVIRTPATTRTMTPVPSVRPEGGFGRPRPARPPRFSRQTATIAAVFAAFCVAGAGYYAFTQLSTQPPATTTVTPAFAAPIPLGSAEQYATQVIGTLRDDGWKRQPPPQRKAEVEEAVKKLPNGVDSLIIKDGHGKVVATGQWLKSPRRVVVKLH